MKSSQQARFECCFISISVMEMSEIVPSETSNDISDGNIENPDIIIEDIDHVGPQVQSEKQPQQKKIFLRSTLGKKLEIFLENLKSEMKITEGCLHKLRLYGILEIPKMLASLEGKGG